MGVKQVGGALGLKTHIINHLKIIHNLKCPSLENILKLHIEQICAPS